MYAQHFENYRSIMNAGTYAFHHKGYFPMNIPFSETILLNAHQEKVSKNRGIVGIVERLGRFELMLKKTGKLQSEYWMINAQFADISMFQNESIIQKELWKFNATSSLVVFDLKFATDNSMRRRRFLFSNCTHFFFFWIHALEWKWTRNRALIARLYHVPCS